ncbi:MAG: DUF87 domain-containing protein [Bacteriovoracaceae bacterium]|nr:DUF87 domain-containing protein [Bacteriovoracaceae bacterium]
MKNKNQNPQLDLFTPFYEIFHELCLIIFDLFKELFKFAFAKVFNLKVADHKIERKALGVKKQTQLEDALGIDTRTKREVNLKSIDFKKHSFIVGASGFGKTNLITILQEHSLRENKPIIFFDPKGDYESLMTFQALCKKYKKPCYIFSEHYKDSISLNPVLDGTANQVTNRIMECFTWTEPHYETMCKSALRKALNQIKADERAFTLKTILDYLKQSSNKDIIGLIEKLEDIVGSDFGRILNAEADGLTFSKVRAERACLYVGLSTQGYGETARALGRLFLGELMNQSYTSLNSEKGKHEAEQNPVSIYFDEFGSIVTKEFIELQNKCRGGGIELTVAVQAAADINKICPDLMNQIIENSGNYFVLKQRLQESAAFFSEAIGTVISKKQTYRIEDGEQQNAGSEREVHELIAHPDIIKNLGVGQCILLTQDPVTYKLINIRNRKMTNITKYNRLMNAQKE